MIDKENKTIVNGKGQIALSVLLGPGILIEGLEGERSPGTNIIDNPPETLDEQVFFDVSEEDIDRVYNDLEEAENNEGGTVEFLEGWKLDFTHYNQKSIDTWRECLDEVTLIFSEIKELEEIVDELNNNIFSVYGRLMELNNANEMTVRVSDEELNPTYNITIEDVRDK